MNAELAGRLAALELPDEWQPVAGRDGADTYRLVRADGSSQWFGRTSMPTISAPALLSRFDAGASNVALFGVGHGTEADLLLGRLGPNRAVFVLEPDLVLVALAFRLHDWSEPIADGRLLLLSGQGIFEQLAEFLTGHEGYLAPERLLSWPWAEPGAMKSATTAFEQAIGRVQADRTRRTTAIREEWSTWPASADVKRPLMVAHALPGARARTDELLLAAGQIGWVAEGFVCDSPARMHSLALCRSLQRHRPTGLLLIDHLRTQAAERYPASVAAVSWLGPHAWPARESDQPFPDRDVVATVSTRQARHVAELGVPAEHIAVVPLAVSSWAFELSPPADDAEDVALLADAAPIDADSHGWRLTSQRVLWEALVEIVSTEAAAFVSQQSEQLLRRAEQRSGVQLAEPSIRQEFLARVERLVGPTLVTRAIAERLLHAGLRVGLWGRGWERHKSVQPSWRGTGPDADLRRSALLNSRIVIEATCDGHGSQLLFDALAAGRVVLARSHPDEGQPGGLATLVRLGQEALPFGDLPGLVRQLKELLSSPQRMTEIAAAGRETARDRHTYRHRLGQLADRLATLQESADNHGQGTE